MKTKQTKIIEPTPPAARCTKCGYDHKEYLECPLTPETQDDLIREERNLLTAANDLNEWFNKRCNWYQSEIERLERELAEAKDSGFKIACEMTALGERITELTAAMERIADLENGYATNGPSTLALEILTMASGIAREALKKGESK